MSASDPPPSSPRFLPVGEAALSVEFGNVIDPAVHRRVIALDLAIAASEIPGVQETMPTYRSLLVCYDPAESTFATMVDDLSALIADMPEYGHDSGRAWTVPVVYGGEYGDDLEGAATQLGLSPEEVVALHCSADYLVYLVGFNPGAPNLGGLPKPLHISRRKLPRPSVPPCSVAIGGMQSGITSIPSPTGWYVLGRTPVRPFHQGRDNPFLFQPGDRIRFTRIGPDEFESLDRLSLNGEEVAILRDTN